MWGSGSESPGVPDGARMVLVLGPSMSRGDACAALAGRRDRVLFVGYGGATEADLAGRLEERFEEPPPVRALGVGGDVEPGDLTGQGITIAEALSLLMDAVVDVESEAMTVRPELTGTN